jgi:type IV pilus assembly protein PilA
MKKNNKGFTLIELIVVVEIIGIIAAVGKVA